MNIKPRTYNQALCLARCLEVEKRVDITYQTLTRMYEHIKSGGNIRITATSIVFLDGQGNTLETQAHSGLKGATSIDFSATKYSVTPIYTSNSGGDLSGSSGNNNNNNNNNNNG